MQPQEFQTILNSLPLLTSQQRNELIEALSEKDSAIGIAETIEANFAKAPKCPHCGIFWTAINFSYWRRCSVDLHHGQNVKERPLNSIDPFYRAKASHVRPCQSK